MTATKIFIHDGVLNFSQGAIASVSDFYSGDRGGGSIFQSLTEGEEIALKEGIYILDEDLDLIKVE